MTWGWGRHAAHGPAARGDSAAASLALMIGPVLLMAALGLTVVVTLGTARPIIGYTIVAALLGLLGAVLSGNVRLLSFWALIVTTSMEFSKYIKTARHQGGEYAFRIEVSDIFLLVLLLYTVLDIARRRDWVVRVPKAAWCWVALLVMTVGTVFFGTWRLLAAMEVVRMFKVTLLFVVVANHVVRRRQVEHLAGAIILGLLIQSVYGLGQYFFGLKLGLERLGEATFMDQSLGGIHRRRIGAMLGHPNIFSGYLAMVLPVALAMVFSKASTAFRLFAGVTLLLGSMAMVLTLSRNGWMAFGMSATLILVASMLHPALRRRTNMLRGSLVLMGMLVLLASSRLLVERLTRSDPTAVSARWEINKVAFKMIADRPVLGHGKNSAAYVMTSEPAYRLRHVEKDRRNPESIPPIHNIYLQEWAEQGTVGIVFFLLMFGLVIKAGVANLALRDETLYALNAGLLAGVLGIMLHGMFDWVFWWNPVMRTFFVLSGGIMAVSYWRLRVEGSSARPPRVKAREA